MSDETKDPFDRQALRNLKSDVENVQAEFRDAARRVGQANWRAMGASRRMLRSMEEIGDAARDARRTTREVDSDLALLRESTNRAEEGLARLDAARRDLLRRRDRARELVREAEETERKIQTICNMVEAGADFEDIKRAIDMDD